MDRLAPLLALAGSEATAFAQDPSPPAPPARERVRLAYVAPLGCPDEQGFRAILGGRLGYDPVDATAPRVLRISITAGAAGFTATAELRSPTKRVLWSRPPLGDADCRTLVDNVGVLVKFAIDPAAAAVVSSPPAEGPPVSLPPSPPPPATPPARDQREPAPPPPASSRPRIRVGARAAGAIGTAPSPAGTISADLGVGWEHFSISGEGRFDLPATGTVAMNVQLQTRLGAGSLVPCGVYGWFTGCGVVTVGALMAEGASPPHAAAGASVYAAAGVRAGIEWPVPGVPVLALRASADALVTVQPVTVRVMGANAWHTSLFSGLLGGGLVLRF
jgi:hypothetical protein